jgi:UDP-glucose 4-epimerase
MVSGLPAPARPVVLDDLSTGSKRLLPSSVQLVIGDPSDELVSQVINNNGMDAIIHFAGSMVVPESVGDPLRYYRNSTCKSRNLIACAG